MNNERTWFLVSNASQSAVPVGNSPIDRHFHNPNPRVKRLHNRYTTFCRASVVRALGCGACFLPAGTGANGAKARESYAEEYLSTGDAVRPMERRTIIDCS